MKPSTSIEFDPKNSVDFHCPFCGLRVVAGMVRGENDVAGAIHAEPRCKAFDELDVFEFIGACASYTDDKRGKA